MRIIARRLFWFLLVSVCILPTADAQASGVLFEQAVAKAASGPANTLSLSFPANTMAGDIILVAFDYDTNTVPSSVTDSQGSAFTPVGIQLSSPGGTRSRVYYAMGIKGGADTVTVNLSGTSGWIELYLTEYTGVNQNNPIDAQAGASGTAGAVSSGNATTTMAGDVIYGFCVGDWNCTAGSGFTARSNFNANLIEDELAGSAGSYAATGRANNGWTMQMLALKPASSGVGAAPVITSATTASGTVGSPFSYQITATNSPTSYGATGLPAGLSMNTGTGLISGTPTAPGTSTINLSATDASGTGPATLTLTVNPAPAPVITSATTASGTVGIAFSYQITAANSPTSYGATGLPSWLSVNTTSGLISGTPPAAGTSSVTLSATDAGGTGNATLTLTVSGSVAPDQLITLSTNGKYLVNSSTGKPVFVVGDDAFDLAVELNSADALTYMTTRANQGFNAIWVAAADNGFQANPPANFYVYSPFDGADFTYEDANYWAHLDSIITQASNLGITVFLNPFFPGNGAEPGYLTSVAGSSDATMSAFGTWIGNRYRGYNNIVWLLGGDSLPSNGTLYARLVDVGAAIAAADPNHLVTLEACQQCTTNGYNSVQAFQAVPRAVPSWLNINWAYPQLTTTVAAAQNAYTSSPFLPPLCGENNYEGGSFPELSVRFEQYAEILSGCYVGRIFGNGAIWNFNSPHGGFGPTPTWQTELSSPGSVSQQYQGRLFSSREHWLLVPDINHTVVTAGYGSGLTVTTAARTSDGQTIIAYIPNGNATTITVAMNQITSSTNTVQGWWFNPTTAATTNIGTFPNSGTQNFTPPDSNDWVLVLDDASAALPAP